MNGLNFVVSNVLYGPNNSKEFCEAWESLSQHLKRKMGLKNEYEDMGTYVREQRAKSGVLDEISIDWSDLQELFERSEAPKKVAVTTGCPLCDKIWFDAEAYEHSGEDSVNNGLAIVMVEDKPWLYILGDDWYVMPVDYCPMCGRKLVED